MPGVGGVEFYSFPTRIIFTLKIVYPDLCRTYAHNRW